MNSELVPGRSLSGVRLGATVAEARAALGEPVEETTNEWFTILHYAGVSLYFRHGRATMLIALETSAYETPEGARVGMPWAELNRLVPDLEFDEDDDLWFSPSHPGVWYDIARPAYDFEQPTDHSHVRVTWEVNDDRAFLRRLYVMEPKEDREDLVAGRSLNRVRVGASPDDVRAVLGEPQRVLVDGPATTWYYPGMMVGFADDVASALVAVAPSDHVTADAVTVGTSWPELRRRVFDDIVFDEDERMWHSPGTPGLWYDVATPSDSPPDPPHVRAGRPDVDDSAIVRRLFVMRPKAPR